MDLHAVKMPSFLLVFAASACFSQACSSSSSDPGPTTGGGGAGGATATGASSTSTGTTTAGTSSATGSGTGGSTGSGTGTGGAGGASDASPLPFVVDSAFIASGFMGDGSVPGAIVQDDNLNCVATRPPGAVGHCHKFTYTPGAMGWGGVYWQYPVNNWGAMPGKRIAPGATKVTFMAAGAAGGETVNFVVGMNMTSDTVSANTMVSLTTAMMPYSISLTGQTYDTVLGGFGWTIAAPDGGPSVAFTVDSIRWEE